jgi:hypothetical protein
MRTVLLVGLLLSLMVEPLSGQAAAARLVVGPNMLVSRDGDMAHQELMLAANPRNARNLLGGAITASRPEGGTATKTYASLDGGQTWRDAQFPEQLRWGGGDPQVAFTPHGTAIFATLAMTPDESGRTRGGMHVYRSEDGGVSWGNAVDLRWSWDHPQITVDHTTGRYAGTVYIGVLYGYPVYRVGVFRSADDGRTWIGPVEAANGGGTVGINVVPMLVLSDGTLIVPYGDFEFLPERRKPQMANGLWFVTSTDGALTFSAPRRIATVRTNYDTRLGTFPALAVDARSSRFRDHLYAVFADADGGRTRILFTRSRDRGQTWTTPRAIEPGVPDAAHQFQPAIAVNDSGVVAVTWFDTRDSGDGRHYHEYITASVDGGDTWLPAARVSTAPSDRFGAGNVRFTPTAWSATGDSLRISFLSPASRWGNGGDYMGLAADASGDFHPFWTDARTGTFQIMTARVHVERTAAGRTAPPTTLAVLTRMVQVLFDPTQYDAATSTATLPIRLRNISQQPLYGPLILEVAGFRSGTESAAQELEPVILNAANGRQGTGATLDFTAAIGSENVLAPGAVTGSIELRVRVRDPLNVPDLNAVVRGRLRAPAGG